VADKELRESFKKISGEDMEIDAYELQDILNAAFSKGTHSTESPSFASLAHD